MSTKVILFRGFPATQTYCPSPFPTKLEFRFRHGRLAYRVDTGSPTTAPKGKIPYVDLSPLQEGQSGPQYLGDSALILQRLIGMDNLEDLNAGLSEEHKSMDLGLRALLEDKLYFYNMRERWVDNYYAHRDMTLWSIPFPVRVFVGMLVFRNITAALHGQGTGRFTSEEIALSRSAIWQQFEDLLKTRVQRSPSNNPFWVLGGTAPSEADATLYGFIVSVLIAPSGPESTALVKGLPSVMDYAERIHDTLFPDYEKWK